MGSVSAPRTSLALVGWITNRKFGTPEASRIHVETSAGSGELLCGYRVPPADDDERTSGGIFRGAAALDDQDAFWPSCDFCQDRLRAGA